MGWMESEAELRRTQAEGVDLDEHCIAKIVEIIASNRSDRRSILQLGYNLGRLSELTGMGREPFWDRWKDAVQRWDEPELARLARELPQVVRRSDQGV